MRGAQYAAGFIYLQAASGVTLDIEDPSGCNCCSIDNMELMSRLGSIRQASRQVAENLVFWYTGGIEGHIVSGIPGILPEPYYWWEAGAMFGTLIKYWHNTGDDRYNHLITEAILFQVGPDDNFMPPNQSASLGNDDQGFWGITAMTAAETAFPNPPAEYPQWLALAQAVFNSMAPRWDKSTCGGGLNWQVYPFNSGYSYKNSVSNGCFFNIAARLGMYTHNMTYLEFARRIWDWSCTAGLVGAGYQVFDGSHDNTNCTIIVSTQWSYNAGLYLLGAAVMWNQVGTNHPLVPIVVKLTSRQTKADERAKWELRINGILSATAIFFQDSVMFEFECEPSVSCNTDQLSFKAYLSRWMAETIKVAPFTRGLILPLLAASAQAAATSCVGGDTSTQCGTRWTVGMFDGMTGVGQEMCALEVIQSNLLDFTLSPVSHGAGGISRGNPAAGTGGEASKAPRVIKTGDRVGAGVLTLLNLSLLVGGAWYVSTSPVWLVYITDMFYRWMR